MCPRLSVAEVHFPLLPCTENASGVHDGLWAPRIEALAGFVLSLLPRQRTWSEARARALSTFT